MTQGTGSMGNEKEEVQYNETVTVSPPTEHSSAGQETPITWKTWIVIFVRLDAE